MLYYSLEIKEKPEVDNLKDVFSSMRMWPADEGLMDALGGLILVIHYNDNTEVYIAFSKKYICIDGKTYRADRDMSQEIVQVFKR